MIITFGDILDYLGGKGRQGHPRSAASNPNYAERVEQI
jgi:hypothetical protein